MGICKKCSSRVDWKKIGKRWFCFNAGTDTDHWDICSKTRTARIVRTGLPFIEDTASDHIEGYKTDLKPSGELLMLQAHISITGENYKQSGDCAECCSPWEICGWPCPDSIA